MPKGRSGVRGKHCPGRRDAPASFQFLKPLVSILIPAYNAERWVADAVRSALAQTWPNKEIILVDDGSTDRTFQIARSLASSQVQVVSTANQGAAAARNHACRLAQGEFIQWLDADDLLAPDKIQRQMTAWAANPRPDILLSSPWASFRFRSRKARFHRTSLWEDLSPAEWLTRKMEDNAFMTVESWLIPRPLSEKSGGWNPRMSADDDGEYSCRLMQNCRLVQFVPDACSYYRMAAPNTLSQVGHCPEKMESQMFAIRSQVKALLAMSDTPRSRLACEKFLHRSLVFFFPHSPHFVEQSQALAQSFGATLSMPVPNWKVRMLDGLMGSAGTRRVQKFVRQLKASALNFWDWLMFRLERSRPQPTVISNPPSR